MYPFIYRFLLTYAGLKFGKKLGRWLFTEEITQINPGSLVMCTLFEHVTHTGIYVGDGNIIHLDGSGEVMEVSPLEFIKRLKIFHSISVNTALSIYVPCFNGCSVENLDAVKRARSSIGPHPYHLLNDNCHRFTAFCLTGNNINKVFDHESKIFDTYFQLEYPSLARWNWGEK